MGTEYKGSTGVSTRGAIAFPGIPLRGAAHGKVRRKGTSVTGRGHGDAIYAQHLHIATIVAG